MSPTHTGQNRQSTPMTTSKALIYSVCIGPCPLLNPDTRIEKRVADIRNELGDQHDEHRDQRAAEQKVDVVVAGCLDQRVAKTLVAEHHLDDDDAGEQPRELQ